MADMKARNIAGFLSMMAVSHSAYSYSGHYRQSKFGPGSKIKNSEARQRSGSQYARDHRGEPGRNGGPKGA